MRVRELGADLAALRQAFDASFAEAPIAPVDHEDLLAVRLGPHEVALRMREITGLHTCPSIMPLPSALPELAGISSLRGVLVPVFDLGALLGLGRTETLRWLVLAGTPTLGLAFERLEHQLRVPASTIVASPGSPSQGFSRATLTTTAGPRPVLDLASLHEEIARRVSLAKENER